MGFGCFLCGYTSIFTHCTVGECPDDTPQWVFYAMAVAMFLYQSFDNCDGKQARRTGTSSPLGEFFDHGVDALVVTLGMFTITTVTGLGFNTSLAMLTTSAWGLFYLATWESYFTGALTLPWFNGAQEGILLMIAVYVTTAVNGPAWWRGAVDADAALRAYLPDFVMRHVPVGYEVLGYKLARRSCPRNT